MELIREQIAIVETLLPTPKRRADGKGQPPRNALEVLMGILWILRMDAPWKDLPGLHPIRSVVGVILSG